MAITKVDLSLRGLLEDLDNGMTWYKRDDQGYGSVQQKYGCKDSDIAKLRLNPKLKDAETNLTIFNLIDDTDDTRTSSSNSTIDTRAAGTSAQVSKVSNSGSDRSSDQEFPEAVSATPVFSSSSSDDDGLSAFASL